MGHTHEEKNKLLVKNISIIGIGTFLTKLISFILIPFYTKWLTTEEYGIYDLLATYVSLCIPFITLQLDQALFRFIMQNKDYSKYYFLKILKLVFPLLISVSLLVSFILLNLNYSDYVVGFILYVVMLSLYNISSEYLRGNEMLIDYSIYNILVGISTVFFSFYFVYYLKLGINGLLCAYGISYGIAAILIIIRNKLYSNDDYKDNTIKMKELLSYSIPLIPNSISWWITNVSDRTLINIFLGNHFNGLYAISCKIPTMLSLVFSVFNLSFQSIAIIANNEDDRKEYYNNLINNLIRLLFTGGIVIIACTSILYYYFIDYSYLTGISAVPSLLCGAIYLSIAQYLGDILLAQKRTSIIGASTISSAVLNIVFNMLIIKLWGINGVAFSTLLAYILMFFVRLLYLKKEISIKEILYKMFFFTLFFLIFSGLTLFFVGNSIIMITIVFISLMIFVIVNRKFLKLVLNKVRGGK